MNAPHAIPRRAGQEGSVTVLTVLMIPILALCIMLVMDIAQLVFEKARLQNVADSCAYSAATVQAAGLNEIADLNFSAEIELVKFQIILAATFAAPFVKASDGQNSVRFYQRVFDKILGYQDKANQQYAEKALSVARKVKKANLDDKGVKGVSIRSINPRDKNGRAGKLMEYTRQSMEVTYCVWVPTPIPLPMEGTNWNDALAGDPAYVGAHNGSTPAQIFGPGRSPATGTVRYRIKKKNSPTTYAAFELTHEPHDLILAPSIFGQAKLQAVAAALPTGGDVEWGLPFYRPVLARLNSLKPKPSLTDLSKVLH